MRRGSRRSVRSCAGQDVVDKLNGEYGEQPSQMQAQIQSGGNAFLAKSFPRLDYIKKATIEKPAAPPPPAKPPVKEVAAVSRSPGRR